MHNEDPSQLIPERETPVWQSLLPGWMQPDAYGRRGIRAYAITGEGKIGDASKAGAIGSGGNYIEHGAGAALFLLKEGGVNIPKVVGPKGRKYLSFSTNGSGTGTDRVEYAPTQYGYASSGHHDFGRGYGMSLDIRIPAKSSITNKSFYVTQMWQSPQLPPVAGLRVKRGTSHTLELVVRGSSNSTATGLQPTADVITQYNLKPGRWHRLDLEFSISPSSQGFIGLAVDGENLGFHQGPIGSRRFGADAPPGALPPPDSYRVKYGIYKESEPGQFFLDLDTISLRFL